MKVNSHIFGSGFRNHVVETAKPKKEWKKVNQDH